MGTVLGRKIPPPDIHIQISKIREYVIFYDKRDLQNMIKVKGHGMETIAWINQHRLTVDTDAVGNMELEKMKKLLALKAQEGRCEARSMECLDGRAKGRKQTP